MIDFGEKDMEFKIPFYNLVNILFIGLVFVGLLVLLFPSETSGLFGALYFLHSPTLEVVFVLALSYQIGLIINWIGSLIVEPLLVSRNSAKRNNLLNRIFKIEWRSYKDYLLAENDKLKMLTREMNVARNNFTSFSIIFVTAICAGKYEAAVLILPPILLFYFAYRKHSKKIVSRIDAGKQKSRS